MGSGEGGGSGAKGVTGASAKTAAVQLKPITYQISLHYMGESRIKFTPATYRCRCELLKESAAAPPPPGEPRPDPATSLQVAPAVIANVVRDKAPNTPGAKPALPASRGGNCSNPSGDEIYRIAIRDNHAVAKGDLNAVFGGALSKPDSYTARGWTPAIKPALPLRVVVRKLLGDEEVSMTDALEVILEIKDPKEELSQTNGNRRDFIKGFFGKYNRTDAEYDPGDDNALKRFGGHREGSAKYPGVKAADVIQVIPYAKPPVAAEGAGNPDAVTFESLSAPTALGTARVVIPVQGVDAADGKKVGVADFAFRPPPLGGDNYRLLLSLRGELEKKGGGKTDIREQKLNGAKVKLVDDQKKSIPFPCSYTTGRFVVWRKIHFRMLVLCNGMAAGGIDFNSIAKTYRKSFIMLESPAHTFTADWKVWRDALQARYAGTPTADAWFADANEANLKLAYAEGLIPGTYAVQPKFKFDHGGTVEYTFSLDPDVHAITRYLIKRACTDPATKLTNPDGNDQKSQDKPDSDGMFVLFAQRMSPDSKKMPPSSRDTTLGEYIGDRIFYMYESTPDDTTDTCAHELGHALFLSHSLTHSYEFSWNGAAVINTMEATNNCAIHDHDQADAATCLMSYTSSSSLEKYPYDPCGACTLGLRFFNKNELQKPANYGQKMFDDVKPAAIVQLDEPNDDLVEAIPDLGVTGDLFLMVVGKKKDWPKSAGTWPARVNLAGLDNVTATGVGPHPGAVNVDPGVQWYEGMAYRKVTGATAGRVEVKFSYNGVTTKAQFDVV